jgi:hypothetical protein
MTLILHGHVFGEASVRLVTTFPPDTGRR